MERYLASPGDSLMDELHDAAREVLLLHPGCTRSQWTGILLSQYRAEVTDALGTDTDIIRAALRDIWTRVNTIPCNTTKPTTQS